MRKSKRLLLLLWLLAIQELVVASLYQLPLINCATAGFLGGWVIFELCDWQPNP